ncbi:hypothetical protein MMC07_009716 [Pseudocyphellaria aurata]|nr:hypothetical protein [Pseudocyphellaria aurata]
MTPSLCALCAMLALIGSQYASAARQLTAGSALVALQPLDKRETICGFAPSASAESPGDSELSGGLGPYLQRSSQYSLFNQVVKKLNQSTSYEYRTTGWFEGPTPQTLLLVRNDVLRKGFAQLAEQYGISNPDTLIDRLIAIADGSTDPRQGTSPTFSKANWASIALLAFAGSHTLPEPLKFYSNQTILNAPYQSPVNLTTSVTGFYSYTGNVQAYAAANAPGPTTVYLRQEGGLQHEGDGLAVPQNFLTATGDNGALDAQEEGSGPATLYVYELDGIFVFGKTFGPADVTGYSGDAAFEHLAQNGI